jgi:hypothetical protein
MLEKKKKTKYWVTWGKSGAPEGYTVPASLSLSEVVDTSKHRKQTKCGSLFICRIKKNEKNNFIVALWKK